MTEWLTFWLPGFCVQLLMLGFVLFWSVRLGRRLAKLRWLKLEMDPKPPENICLHLRDGRTIPVDSVLSPMRTWRVVVPDGITNDDVEDFSIGKLHGYSHVQIAIRREKG